MLSCRQATRLMSEAQDRKLGLAEKMSLELHLAMCKGCTNYRAQVSFLRDACRRYLADVREGREGRE